MITCNKCLEQRFGFEYSDKVVVATCQNCGNEIHIPKKEKQDDTKPCRKCKGVVILKECKPNKKHTHIYYCLKCHTVYLDKKFLKKETPENRLLD